ncbi:hypothetical protein DSL72_005397 [Monilinia vaccinii-corymbosi]|uniref:Uncharacterized protein n=1 Tax=Monilinia vaccinii-corymbosi TaxID=61207 RepID=A0A8A3PFJ0_9HELO|nr:hypothetical protein DSL72_005397 [Monilinia vaccinii-corymbosi]
MPLFDLIRKKEKVVGDDALSPRADPEAGPAFTFMRADTQTTSQEAISPTSLSSSDSFLQPSVSKPNRESRTSRLFRGRPTSNLGASGASISSQICERSLSISAHNSKRISERFGMRKHEAGSSHVPSDLPEITVEEAAQDGRAAELQWEKRATMLAHQNERSISRPVSACGSPTDQMDRKSGESFGAISPEQNPHGVVDSRTVDDDLQEAIRLHEEGHLEEATKLFERLADPNGANNALSQVLYGLALRHGWGCQASPADAVTYLSAAASNAAAIEELALQSGKMKGGAAKGELVIAIYELANCFRNGWGVKVDPTAAQKVSVPESLNLGNLVCTLLTLLQYYQTAAELGDTDSMNEAAKKIEHQPRIQQTTIVACAVRMVLSHCILGSNGAISSCTFNRMLEPPANPQNIPSHSRYEADDNLWYRAAYYLRKAENAGVKTLGNSW